MVPLITEGGNTTLIDADLVVLCGTKLLIIDVYTGVKLTTAFGKVEKCEYQGITSCFQLISFGSIEKLEGEDKQREDVDSKVTKEMNQLQ